MDETLETQQTKELSNEEGDAIRIAVENLKRHPRNSRISLEAYERLLKTFFTASKVVSIKSFVKKPTLSALEHLKIIADIADAENLLDRQKNWSAPYLVRRPNINGDAPFVYLLEYDVCDTNLKTTPLNMCCTKRCENLRNNAAFAQ